jgi:hypothetical protein
MKLFDDKYKYMDPRIQPRMQLRSDICKYFESWSVENQRKIKASCVELQELLNETDPHHEPRNPPLLEMMRKPLRK